METRSKSLMKSKNKQNSIINVDDLIHQIQQLDNILISSEEFEKLLNAVKQLEQIKHDSFITKRMKQNIPKQIPSLKNMDIQYKNNILTINNLVLPVTISENSWDKHGVTTYQATFVVGKYYVVSQIFYCEDQSYQNNIGNLEQLLVENEIITYNHTECQENSYNLTGIFILWVYDMCEFEIKTVNTYTNIRKMLLYNIDDDDINPDNEGTDTQSSTYDDESE